MGVGVCSWKGPLKESLGVLRISFKNVGRGKPEGNQRETRGKPEGNQRETRGKPEGNQRETTYFGSPSLSRLTCPFGFPGSSNAEKGPPFGAVFV